LIMTLALTPACASCYSSNGATTLTKPSSIVSSMPSPPNSPRVCTCMSVVGAHALEDVAEQIEPPISVRCRSTCSGTNQECVRLRQQQRRHDADQSTEEN